jgi:hypothetical protein
MQVSACTDELKRAKQQTKQPNQTTMGRFLTARFKSKCAETGQTINKGDRFYFEVKAYSKDSKYYKLADKPLDLGYIEANENAYFDNFCIQNNI